MLKKLLTSPELELLNPRVDTQFNNAGLFGQSDKITNYIHRFKGGELINNEAELGNSIFVIFEGWVSLFKSLPNGQMQIIDFGLPGDHFDLSSADGVTAVIGLQTITEASVAIIPHDVWAALVQSSPQLAQVSEGGAAAIRSRIAERMLRLGRGTAEERLAYTFLELGVRSGAMQGSRPNSFHLPLTQQQIGDFMGLTSVHVCRTMRRMVREGIITTRNHIDIDVLEVATMEEVAGISVETLAQEILLST